MIPWLAVLDVKSYSWDCSYTRVVAILLYQKRFNDTGIHTDVTVIALLCSSSHNCTEVLTRFLRTVPTAWQNAFFSSVHYGTSKLSFICYLQCCTSYKNKKLSCISGFPKLLSKEKEKRGSSEAVQLNYSTGITLELC